MLHTAVQRTMVGGFRKGKQTVEKSPGHTVTSWNLRLSHSICCSSLDVLTGMVDAGKYRRPAFAQFEGRSRYRVSEPKTSVVGMSPGLFPRTVRSTLRTFPTTAGLDDVTLCHRHNQLRLNKCHRHDQTPSHTTITETQPFADEIEWARATKPWQANTNAWRRHGPIPSRSTTNAERKAKGGRRKTRQTGTKRKKKLGFNPSCRYSSSRQHQQTTSRLHLVTNQVQRRRKLSLIGCPKHHGRPSSRLKFRMPSQGTATQLSPNQLSPNQLSSNLNERSCATL